MNSRERPGRLFWMSCRVDGIRPPEKRRDTHTIERSSGQMQLTRPIDVNLAGPWYVIVIINQVSVEASSSKSIGGRPSYSKSTEALKSTRHFTLLFPSIRATKEYHRPSSSFSISTLWREEKRRGKVIDILKNPSLLGNFEQISQMSTKTCYYFSSLPRPAKSSTEEIVFNVGIFYLLKIVDGLRRETRH